MDNPDFSLEKYPRPSDDEIKASLTPEQYHVTQQSGTEPPFRNAYWDNHEKGIYVDVVTGEPLFSSREKFDSGTGWPSFSRGINDQAFVLVTDRKFGMERVEVRSRSGDSHLGHVFYGEPTSPQGVRYCMNSASLRFIPYEKMEQEGYAHLMRFVEGDSD